MALVYANKFLLNPDKGPDQIIRIFAEWVDHKLGRHTYIDRQKLAGGINELKLGNGLIVSSWSTSISKQKEDFPFLFCARLSHPDREVSGRLWITEMGLRQEKYGQHITCSVCVKTEENSADAYTEITASCPKFIPQLINRCNAVGYVPGLEIKQLTQESAKGFLSEVERTTRDFPIVLVSADQRGEYSVELERLRSVLVGLADVVYIPRNEDTFAIERSIGRQLIVFNGAIRIIFFRHQKYEYYFQDLLTPDKISDIVDETNNLVEYKILSRITHRTNLPFFWGHISKEKVDEARFRKKLRRTIDQYKNHDQSQEIILFTELLKEADKDLILKDEELQRADEEIKKLQSNNDGLSSKCKYLEHALSSRGDQDGNNLTDRFESLRNLISTLIDRNLNLQKSIEIISMLYPERVVFLETSIKSAKESDNCRFEYANQAFELLHKLATDYWEMLADGQGDQNAHKVFGKNKYSSRESEKLSNDGEKCRTFTYQGKDIFMDKHLKIGVKPSDAKTLRMHFEWLPGEQKIIVGHCGKHLKL